MISELRGLKSLQCTPDYGQKGYLLETQVGILFKQFELKVRKQPKFYGMNISYDPISISNETGLTRIKQAQEAWQDICRSKNHFPNRYFKLKALAESASEKGEYIYSGQIDWVIHLNQVQPDYFLKLEEYSSFTFLIRPHIQGLIPQALVVIECFIGGHQMIEKLIQLERNLIATEQKLGSLYSFGSLFCGVIQEVSYRDVDKAKEIEKLSKLSETFCLTLVGRLMEEGRFFFATCPLKKKEEV